MLRAPTDWSVHHIKARGGLVNSLPADAECHWDWLVGRYSTRQPIFNGRRLLIQPGLSSSNLLQTSLTQAATDISLALLRFRPSAPNASPLSRPSRPSPWLPLCRLSWSFIGGYVAMYPLSLMISSDRLSKPGKPCIFRILR